MKIIPKGELLSYGFCEFGEEDEQGRYVAEEELVVLTKEEHDSLLRIARSAQPMIDALKIVRKALVAPCIGGYKLENSPHKELVELIDKAISGNDADK